MMCKRSLYCWKNGPCASDQTRKEIWEDNIRFRENLRDLNQSDHYWSFQITKTSCLCLEEEDLPYSRPFSRKQRSASLQGLNQIDCTSVTHSCNGLKSRNCFVHYPALGFTKDTEIKRSVTPIPQSLVATDFTMKQLVQPLSKSDEDQPKYCCRYKNPLALKPSLKKKCLSQTNLSFLNDTNSSSLKKKSFHTSCDNIKVNCSKNKTDLKNQPEKTTVKVKQADNELKVQKKTKKTKTELKPIVKFSNQENLHGCVPISRTTRKLLSENKKIPFAIYGCNNNSSDIGKKKTHNVLVSNASKSEVYPNALSAKQQKRNLIMKYIQSEKEFQRKCVPEDVRKRLVNHSSLWSLDSSGKEEKSTQKKNTKNILPLINNPQKKQNVTPSLMFCYHKNNNKHQYFY